MRIIIIISADKMLFFLIKVYVMESNKPERAVNVTDFHGTYVLDGLRPYTEYSVYVIVGLVGGPQESVRSMTVTGKTLAGGK